MPFSLAIDVIAVIIGIFPSSVMNNSLTVCEKTVVHEWVSFKLYTASTSVSLNLDSRQIHDKLEFDVDSYGMCKKYRRSYKSNYNPSFDS